MTVPLCLQTQTKIYSFNKYLCKLGTENTNKLNDKFTKSFTYIAFPTHINISEPSSY